MEHCFRHDCLPCLFGAYSGSASPGDKTAKDRGKIVFVRPRLPAGNGIHA